jgi:hypothetical protein
MYGKSYESMYEGSMVGAGINVFAVWNYIITKARGGAVEINPRLLAFTLGGKEDEVVAALEFLQQPDPISRSKDCEGRRLIKDGQFQYRVVNWEKYQEIKNAADKREYNRVKQAEYRAKKSSQSTVPEPEKEEIKKNGIAHLTKRDFVANDDAWLTGLEQDPTYAGLNIRTEFGKMSAWCSANHKQPSRRRFVNWINRADKPLNGTSNQSKTLLQKLAEQL